MEAHFNGRAIGVNGSIALGMNRQAQLDYRERNLVLALKKERQRQGVSAARLAHKIGIGRNTIPNLERDEARPTLWVLLKMADGLKMNLATYLQDASDTILP